MKLSIGEKQQKQRQKNGMKMCTKKLINLFRLSYVNNIITSVEEGDPYYIAHLGH